MSPFLMKPLVYFYVSLVTATLLLPLPISLGDADEDDLPPSPPLYDAFQPNPSPAFYDAPNDLNGEDPVVLAPRRTYRKDPLDHFEMYTAGWNITSRHYWASVGYSAAPFFAIAAIWFAAFGVCLSLILVCYFCRRKQPYGYSPLAYAISLIFLILLSIAAIIGCFVLYTGQEKFHGSTTTTLDYVVSQADGTADTLRNVSEHLVAAKQTTVVQVSLPPTVQADIDQLHTMIDASATTLTTKAEENSRDIKKLTDSVRLALLLITAAMLILILLGSAFSMLGMTVPLYIVVTAGWILVTATFILCGIFLILHNVAGDSCRAMSQWIQNPTPHTTLDEILPCVDHATSQQTLAKSKQVTSQLVDLINTVITNVSNINFASNFVQLYFNQSGPLLPILCNPFHPDLSTRPCSPSEVSLNNATQVWSGYTCRASPSGICLTTGRLSPNLYSQFSATVDVCNGLYQYSPFLIQLEDCSYAKQTFMDVETNYCPGLEKHSHRVYVGLVMVATAVMLSLIFWVIYGRERRHRRHANRKGFVYGKNKSAGDDDDGHGHGHNHGDKHL